MNKVGIFFGTDTGTTRLIAKRIAMRLGEERACKPLNINRASLQDVLSFDALILGTPSYGQGQVPGCSTGVAAGSWEEFLPQLQGQDLSGKVVALYGLGNQEKYPDHFADAMAALYGCVTKGGATVVGAWDTAGYTFKASRSVVDGRFIGLALDQNSQALLTNQRIETWLEMVGPALLTRRVRSAAAV